MNNDNLPPPPNEEPPPPVVVGPAQPPLSKKACAALGFGLFVVGALSVIVFPLLPLVGFIAAFVSLFYREYRCIFLGYILTLGVFLLAAILYCMAHPLRID
jgi:hypothetical protein